MADNDNQQLSPPCSKCKGRTTFYRRIVDPEKNVAYELFDCAACGLATVQKTPDGSGAT